MVGHYLLLWLSILVVVGAQPQPPGPPTSFQNLLPRPLIQFKLDKNRNIITSAKNKKQWHSFYTVGGTAATDEPDPAGPVVSVNGSTLPPYNTIVRPFV